jgi:hypothetical protein
MKMSSLEFLVVCQQGLCSLSLSLSLSLSVGLCVPPKRATKIFKLESGPESDRKKTQTNKQTNQKNSAGLVQCALAAEGGTCPRGWEQKLLTGYPNTNIGRLQQTKPNWFNNNNKTNQKKKNMKGDHCPTWYDTPAKLQCQLQNSLLHISIWRHSKTDYYCCCPFTNNTGTPILVLT